MDGDLFVIKDCTLLPIATGISVQTLSGLRKELADIDADSIYYHFWGYLLSPRFVEPEFMNDFAYWAFHALHDKVLAERLSVIDPARFADMEGVRQKLLDVIDERLDELDVPPVASSENKFYFVKSQMVVFDTHRVIHKPEQLKDEINRFSNGSIFYHFVDARRRQGRGVDDFRTWLLKWGTKYRDLCTMIERIDPHFMTLPELRERLSKLFNEYFSGGEGKDG